MTYTLKIYEADGVTDAEREQAQQRFRRALESALGGDASLVAPMHRAYQHVLGTYGESPDPDSLNDAERAVFEAWRAAETAAVAAAFGSHRYMGDAFYELQT